MFENQFPYRSWDKEPINYIYTYTSSLDDKVFYVGLGTDDRYLQHIKEAVRVDISQSTGKPKKPSRIVSTIRAIWKQGGKVIIRKPHVQLERKAAEEFEQSLIKRHVGTIVNVSWVALNDIVKVPPVYYGREESA